MDEKIEQLFYAALGGALSIKGKLENSNEDIKAWQQKSEDNARAFFDQMAQRGKKEKDSFKVMFKEILQEVVEELNLATRDDLEKLKQELGK